MLDGEFLRAEEIAAQLHEEGLGPEYTVSFDYQKENESSHHEAKCHVIFLHGNEAV